MKSLLIPYHKYRSSANLLQNSLLTVLPFFLCQGALALIPPKMTTMTTRTTTTRTTRGLLGLTSSSSSSSSIADARHEDNCNDERDASLRTSSSSSRRQVLTRAVTTVCTTTAALCLPSVANAADGGGGGGDTKTSSSSLTAQSILDGLRGIPTFCIVDDQGAAYMLYKPNEGFAKGYAFVTYEGAEIVLKDAQETAAKGGYSATWEPATITTIPANVALRLTLQPRQRTSQRDQQASSILFLIPGAAERDAAMQIDTKSKFSEQGRIPLFYFETFRRETDGRLPLYFDPRQLLEDWKSSTTDNGNNAVPPRIQVVDLITLFGAAVRGRGNDAKLVPPILNTAPLAFVPTAESVRRSKDLQQAGKIVPYKLDRMIV